MSRDKLFYPTSMWDNDNHHILRDDPKKEGWVICAQCMLQMQTGPWQSSTWVMLFIRHRGLNAQQDTSAMQGHKQWSLTYEHWI